MQRPPFRLFAWKGSFAVTSKDNDGCYVSNEFPCFLLNRDRADGNYLWRYFSRASAWEEALEFSTGETPSSRNRLKEEKFLAMKIPLPPIPEQQRIVARIEELAARIEEARGLRQLAAEETERSLICMAHRRDLDDKKKASGGWRKVPLRKIMKIVDDSHPVQADRVFPNIGIYSYGRGLFSKPPIEGTLTSATTLRRIRKGQFIYSRLFAFEGAYGLVTEKFDGHFVSNEYPTFDCDPKSARGEFVVSYFKSPAVWQEVATGSKGLGHRRQRVQPEQILSYVVWLPPLEWQDRIAEVKAQVDAMKKLQAESAAELDAMLPSILEKAFKGEL